LIHLLWTDPKIYSYKFKTFPYLLTSINYVFCLIGICALNTISTLAMEDYCKRSSPIYDPKRSSQQIKQIMHKINEEHKGTREGQSH
jgi:hypothetical protein